MKESKGNPDRANDAHRSLGEGGQEQDLPDFPAEWWIVYRIESIRDPSKACTRVSHCWKRRMGQHNRGENSSMAPFAPYR